jgi:hypothetical protein
MNYRIRFRVRDNGVSPSSLPIPPPVRCKEAFVPRHFSCPLPLSFFCVSPSLVAAFPFPAICLDGLCLSLNRPVFFTRNPCHVEIITTVLLRIKFYSPRSFIDLPYLRWPPICTRLDLYYTPLGNVLALLIILRKYLAFEVSAYLLKVTGA